MGRPKIIAISGGSGSGKTTIVNKVREQCGDEGILTLHMDHYYRDLSPLAPAERDHCNFDHPDAFDLELLRVHLSELAAGQSVERPTYDFATHTRTGATVELKPQAAVILDGILSLNDPQLRPIFDLSVYVEVSDDVRFIRRLKRDIAERGRTVDGVIQQYLQSVKPMHDAHVAPQKNVADIIISWETYNTRAIEMLSDMVRSWLRDGLDF